MKIRLDVEGTTITATLHDNATSRDFVSLLPLTLSLTDYAATEKISNLPRELSTEGAPPGSDPSVGDITYYACVSACGPPLTGSVMSQSRSTFRRNGGLTRLGFRIG